MIILPEYLASLGPPGRQLPPGTKLPGNLDYVRIPEGSIYELPCNITNSPDPKSWTKDGQLIRPPAAGDVNRVLSFNPITKSDSGIYKCDSGRQEYIVLVDVVPQEVQGRHIL